MGKNSIIYNPKKSKMEQLDQQQIKSVAAQEKTIICSTCHIRFDQIVNYKLHLTTEFHIYNTKRRVAELAPITEDVFDEKRAQAIAPNASAITEVFIKCQPCNKSFKSNEQLAEHCKSKKHKKNEKEYRSKHPDADDSSIFKSLGHSLDQSAQSDSDKGAMLLGALQEKHEEGNSEGGRPAGDGKAPAEKLVVEENSEEQLSGKRRMTALENPRCCLFCDKQCAGMKKCLDHMRIKHSFVILDVDCLVDLKGLQTYLAERIQIGQLCLFCSRSFKDPIRCQQHMIDKGHCMMNMEDEDEYVDFYDFSKTYENHPLLLK